MGALVGPPRRVVHDVAVQLESLAEAGVERDAEHHHFLIRWDWLKDDDAAAERQ